MCTVTALNGSPLYKDDPSREHVITYKKKALFTKWTERVMLKFDIKRAKNKDRIF